MASLNPKQIVMVKDEKDDDQKLQSDTSKSTVSGEKRPAKKKKGGNSNKRIKKETTSATNKTKVNKGLRHFSMMVCKKVEEKGTTTYNEVADELVKDFVAQREAEEQEEQESLAKGEAKDNKKKKRSYDEKNIRRRVYDALNVLMAMDILWKEKKEIRWKGLPSQTHADSELLHRELVHRQRNVQQKRSELQYTLNKFICNTNLSRRNQMNAAPSDDQIPLPFYLVSHSPEDDLQCEISSDSSYVTLKTSSQFTLSENNDVLRHIGM